MVEEKENVWSESKVQKYWDSGTSWHSGFVHFEWIVPQHVLQVTRKSPWGVDTVVSQEVVVIENRFDFEKRLKSHVCAPEVRARKVWRTRNKSLGDVFNRLNTSPGEGNEPLQRPLQRPRARSHTLCEFGIDNITYRRRRISSGSMELSGPPCNACEAQGVSYVCIHI
jgi:hypothetical protein